MTADEALHRGVVENTWETLFEREKASVRRDSQFSVLLDNVLLLGCVQRHMVGVGRISILDLLQNAQ